MAKQNKKKIVSGAVVIKTKPLTEGVKKGQTANTTIAPPRPATPPPAPRKKK